MMISKYLVTGDMHGDFSRFYKIQQLAQEANETWGIIILGDAGVNFWLSKRDKVLKYRICHKYPNLQLYLLRGNHDERPQNISTMRLEYDINVHGDCYYEADYSNIHYLIDGQIYIFGYHKALCLGGAYSVDKYWRLELQSMGSYAGWFPDEQLSKEEMQEITNQVKGKSVDFIFSHTCPLSFQPIYLFSPYIDQSTVDNSMETWLEELKDQVQWKSWCFGHYHEDRIIHTNPNIRMFFHSITELEALI